MTSQTASKVMKQSIVFEYFLMIPGFTAREYFQYCLTRAVFSLSVARIKARKQSHWMLQSTTKIMESEAMINFNGLTVTQNIQAFLPFPL